MPSLPASALGARSLRSARAGYCGGLAALLVFFGCESLQNATAEGETRTISFHHTHTGEDLTVTYKVNGRYDEAALEKINYELRDWREAQPTKMDPHLIDLLWEVHRETGSKEPIWVVCGYRSPETNSMLRRHSSGVAKFSQHMLGKAVDFYIPGVPLDKLRAAGLRAQRGGVGFYPTSGSPFVHLDTGSVRHWPRMPEQQLVAVLAKGPLASQNTSDNGTVTAQTNVSPPTPMSSFLARLFGGGKDEEEDAETAAQPAPVPAKPAPGRAAAPAKTHTAAATPLPPARPAKPAGDKVAADKPATDKPASYQVASAAMMPAPIQSAFALASTTSKPVILAADDDAPATARQPSRPAQAASLVARANMTANEIINERGYWQGLPSAAETEPASANAQGAGKSSTNATNAPPPAARAAAFAAVAARRQAASADPVTTASVTPWPLTSRGDSEPVPNALAYAAQPTPIAAARTLPMGTGAGTSAARAAQGEVRRSEERFTAAPPATPTKVKGTAVVRVGDRFNDPWMRAMIVSPSAHSFMRTTVYGAQDFRGLQPYLQKPITTVAMTFTDDPHFGMATDTFTGNAVAFTPTVTFSQPRTAAATRR